MKASIYVNRHGEIASIVDDGHVEILLRQVARNARARVTVKRVARVRPVGNCQWEAYTQDGLRRRFKTRADAVEWEHRYFNLKLGQV